jgi:hypothetical protein
MDSTFAMRCAPGDGSRFAIMQLLRQVQQGDSQTQFVLFTSANDTSEYDCLVKLKIIKDNLVHELDDLYKMQMRLHLQQGGLAKPLVILFDDTMQKDVASSGPVLALNETYMQFKTTVIELWSNTT